MRFMRWMASIALLMIATACTSAAMPPYEVRIDPAVAEKLLAHKFDPVCKPVVMGARVTGTVVVAIEISTQGDVLHPVIISGPKLLRKAALDAVRQYKYMPYTLSGMPIQAETTVSIRFTCD